MTVMETPTTEAAGGRDPRGLISPETFGLLVEDIMRYHPVTRPYAERMMGQALVFLIAHAKTLHDSEGDRSQWLRIAPSRAVDPAWHAFILRSKAYVEFCDRYAGRYMHHLPVMDDDIRSGAALERAVPLMEATGYQVDMEFWNDPGSESCCPENCGTIGNVGA
ncbi:hypothetical protein [Thermomonospora umbrina]|uniref:Uncharacterized protein n=1 Tax=Thermomonospora umbrina TaxID=111806 RepID=A0A3D9SMK0_9ACTN|nr:hypothetical protein [Thermomonospora umbrina]REE96957.1 hypothetical protein DFJ69_2410 [Thermomonospora umbrina]